jgi:hypothetical protein
MTLVEIIDIAIVLCGVYASLSVLSSWVHERIAAALGLRGWNLFKGIVHLVGGHDVAARIFNHPLVAATSRRPDLVVPKAPAPNALLHFWNIVATRPPSYLDARNFSSAFWQVVQESAAPAAANPPSGANAPADDDEITALGKLVASEPDSVIATLKNSVAAIEAPPSLKKQMLSLLAQAGNDYDKLLAATDGWFNAQMDRVSGWYKRQSQWIMIGLAFLIVSLSGVDTLEMVRTLSVLDPTQLTSIADDVQKRVTKDGSAALTPAPLPTLAPAGQTNGPTTVSPFDLTQFAHPHPDLWTNWGWESKADNGKVYQRGPGMALTLLALALGGPFWFDSLCSLANVRAAGRKPRRSDQPSA